MKTIGPILIIGGAGYIGSHLIDFCQSHDIPVVTLDNLSTGHRDAITNHTAFYQGDMADNELLSTILQRHGIKSVIHLAAFIEVGESILKPDKYYQNNLIKSIQLIDTLIKHNVKEFIFSSTAAVYGEPQTTPINENHPCNPISPYGISKYAVEQVLRTYASAYGLQYAALRYFNASGAHPKGHLRERHQPETHIIPLLLEVANNERKEFTVYGTDYDTPDGTCVRDFIHVTDLCSAHIAALQYLHKGGQPTAFNLGNNQGYSVKQIIQATEKITNKSLRIQYGKKREGDPAILVADASKMRQACDWQPKYSHIDTIIQHAWAAKQKHKSQIKEPYSLEKPQSH